AGGSSSRLATLARASPRSSRRLNTPRKIRSARSTRRSKLMNPGTEIIPRATVESIVATRDRCLESYASAYTAIAGAAESIEAARKLLKACGPTQENRFSAGIDREKTHFHYSMNPPPAPEYL